MNESQRQELYAHIKARIEELIAQLPSLKEASQPVSPDPALGRLTRLDAMQGKEMNEAAYRQIQTELTALNQALERTTQSRFGLCENCDEPISMGRLKALPATQFCIQCA